jgi:ATP-binding cassette subfamily F protein 3
VLEQAVSRSAASAEAATVAPSKEEQAGGKSDGGKPKRLNPIKKKQIEDRVRELEQEISETEARIAQCEASLQTFVSAEETQTLTQELNESRKQLQVLVAEWEELSGVLEQTT